MTGSTTTYDPWSEPELIRTDVFQDHIELIYKQTYMATFTGLAFSNEISQQVFKIIYSCVDGSWNVSERIPGKIIPAANEYYEFE